jgi:uncharacterized protein YlaI
MTGVLDPLGLRRCSLCSNAFAYDADETLTARLRRVGILAPSSFVCRFCAARHRDLLEEIAAAAEKEVEP